MKTPENMFDLKQIKFAVECLTCWSGSVDETLDESIAMNTIYYALQIAKEIAEGKAFVCRVEDIQNLHEVLTKTVGSNVLQFFNTPTLPTIKENE